MAKTTTEKESKKKVPASKSKKNKTAQIPEIREEQIRITAYYRWEEKGKNHGSHVEDWLEAEDLLTD